MVQCVVSATIVTLLLSLSARADALSPAPEAIYSHQIPVKLWGVTQLKECVFAIGSPEPDKVVTGKVSLAGDVEFDFQDGRSLFVRSGDVGPTGMVASVIKQFCFLRFDI